MAVEALAQRWRDEVVLLRRRGADAQAAALESCASELEEEVRRLSLEALTLEQAAEESGYSYSAVQKMVATGRLPNAGGRHSPRIRRRDLPKKPSTHREQANGEPDLASLVLAH
jgi:hypothetical protein